MASDVLRWNTLHKCFPTLLLTSFFIGVVPYYIYNYWIMCSEVLSLPPRYNNTSDHFSGINYCSGLLCFWIVTSSTLRYCMRSFIRLFWYCDYFMKNKETVDVFIFYFCNKKKMLFCFRWIKIKLCKTKQRTQFIPQYPLILDANPLNFI